MINKRTSSVMGAKCKGQDPEDESMKLGCCAVYLEDACTVTPSVLLQSSTDVNDFLLGRLVERCST